MPHIEIRAPKGVREDSLENLEDLVGELELLRYRAKKENVTTMEKYGWEFLGSGAESVVLRYKDDPDMVVSISFTPDNGPIDAQIARKTFWLNKLFHTIFPENFRDIPFVIGKLNHKQKISERMEKRHSEKLETPLYGTKRRFIDIENDKKSKMQKSFSEVIRFFFETEIMDKNNPETPDEIENFFDLTLLLRGKDISQLTKNVQSTTDSNSIYVDLVNSRNPIEDNKVLDKIIENKEKIKDYFKENFSGTEEDKKLGLRKIEMCIERLASLKREKTTQ